MQVDAGNKADVQPSENYEDDGFLKARFDRPEVKEGEVQLDTRERVPADNNILMEDGTSITFRELSDQLDDEEENLIKKLDCLNG